MRFFRRRSRLEQIDETEAYDRSYGDARRDVKIVKQEPRRPRNRDVLADGERLRQAFLERLEKRDKEG